MCLIGLIGFIATFGKNPVNKDGQVVNGFSEKLMGPGFADLVELTNKSRETLLPMKYEEMSVISADGLKLAGYFFRNEISSNKTAICVHGYNSNGFVDFATISLEYIRRGYNVLLVANRASVGSEGKWTGFGILECKDTLLWTKKIADMFPEGKIVLHGCSMGAATVDMMSNLMLPKNVKAIISDCAFTAMDEEIKYTIKYMAHLPSFPILNTMQFWCKKLAKYSFSDNSPIKAVAEAKIPIFFVHGKEDRFIPCEAAKRLYDVCPTDKELLIIDGAGHAASQLRGKDKYNNGIFDFIEKQFSK